MGKSAGMNLVEEKCKKNSKWMRIKGRENEKVNNSAIILSKGTAEVQCNGLVPHRNIIWIY